MKRTIYGLVRYIESELSDNGECNVPESYFESVPDHIGYAFHYDGDPDTGEELRCFYTREDWICGQDDCGGLEENPEDTLFTGIKDNVIHLKLVVDNEK